MLIRILTVLIAGVAIVFHHTMVSLSRRQQFRFSDGSRLPRIPPASPLTDEEVQSFHRDGYLLYRGMIEGLALQDAQQASRQVVQSFSLLDYIFKSFTKVNLQLWRRYPEFARLAFESYMPSIAAQLMGEQTSVRVLKDALFAQTKRDQGCGFHVDDAGFFPTNRETKGIQFWIALDSFSKTEGGGLRIVRGSHTAPYAEECRRAVLGGYNRTCTIAEHNPKCNELLEKDSLVFDMEPGDVIFWDRYTFHRTEPFRQTKNEPNVAPLSRYTIRYIPSNARALDGGLLHRSMKEGEVFSGAYYPQVWPHANHTEIKKILEGLGDDVHLPSVFLTRFLSKIGLANDPYRPQQKQRSDK